MTCAESLCCGTPVAGFCSGAPETVFLPPTAAFVPYGDLEALAAQVRAQLENGLSREEIFQEGRRCYSLEVMYQQTLALYYQVTGERPQ